MNHATESLPHAISHFPFTLPPLIIVERERRRVRERRREIATVWQSHSSSRSISALHFESCNVSRYFFLYLHVPFHTSLIGKLEWDIPAAPCASSFKQNGFSPALTSTDRCCLQFLGFSPNKLHALRPLTAFSYACTQDTFTSPGQYSGRAHSHSSLGLPNRVFRSCLFDNSPSTHLVVPLALHTSS